MDLGKDPKIVILRTISRENSVGFGAFDDEFDENPTELLTAMMQNPDAFSKRRVPDTYWPKLVAFENMEDPLSVFEVNKTDIYPDAAGPYFLSHVEIEILAEQPSTKFDISASPWLSSLGKGSIDGEEGVTSGDRPHSNRLYRSNFILADKK